MLIIFGYHLPVSSSRSTRMPRIGKRRWYTVFGYRRRSIFRTEVLMNRCTVFLSETRGRGTVLEPRMSTFWLRTIVTTNLYHALKMNVHAIGEFESLEVSEADDRGARTKVLYLLEPASNEESLHLVSFIQENYQ